MFALDMDQPWSRGFFSRLHDFLTERPAKVPKAAAGSFSQLEYRDDFLDNLKDFFRAAPRGTVRSRLMVEWKPWYQVLWENLRDTIAPPKLPPLKLTSKPVKVRDLWSRNEQFRRAQAFSLTAHAVIAILLVAPIAWWHATQAEVKAVGNVDVIDISPYLPQLPPGKDKAGGGGGGGERMNTPPTRGKVPRFDWLQKTPPMAVIRNPNPKLEAEPTLLGPPELRVPSPDAPNYGDPLAKLFTGSGGPGGGGGIGTGCCGGIGSGDGGGLGPGSGGGTGGGPFRPGTAGVGYPECAYCPTPEFSEEARKAKHQGIVLLRVIITPDGRAINISVAKGLGLGLDEKAIEAVRTWRFRPATGPGGKPVAVETFVEVVFRLL